MTNNGNAEPWWSITLIIVLNVMIFAVLQMILNSHGWGLVVGAVLWSLGTILGRWFNDGRK